MLVFVRQIILDCRTLTSFAFQIMRTHLAKLGAFALALSLVALFAGNYDAKLYNSMKEQRDSSIKQIARNVSYCAELQRGPTILAVGLWGVGFACRRKRWQMAAVACLLAALLAGITADVARVGAGRPRPRAEMQDGFYGIKWSDKFHGFVSAHRATSFGMATALTVAFPATGILTLPLATFVAWSRMTLGNHFLSDCLLGTGVGLWFGVPFGLAARRGLPAEEPYPIDGGGRTGKP
jgi:membrane-associated phospholipid phosphatase